MARKDDILGVSGSETVIGTGVTLTGDLISDNDISIDGNLKGKISTQGSLVIGVNANIVANVSARSVQVSGSLIGNVIAEDEVSITETGRVQGDITTGTIMISSGAIFSGKSIMKQPEATDVETPNLAHPDENDS
jgi:cytoskeletal protein CcmA (bactofilin family)